MGKPAKAWLSSAIRGTTHTPDFLREFGLIAHVAGQPHRVAAVRQFLDYVKAKSQVWMPTREELAAWYLEHDAEHISPSA